MSHSLRIDGWTMVFNSDLSGTVTVTSPNGTSHLIPGTVFRAMLLYQLSRSSDDMSQWESFRIDAVMGEHGSSLHIVGLESIFQVENVSPLHHAALVALEARIKYRLVKVIVSRSPMTDATLDKIHSDVMEEILWFAHEGFLPPDPEPTT